MFSTSCALRVAAKALAAAICVALGLSPPLSDSKSSHELFDALYDDGALLATPYDDGALLATPYHDGKLLGTP